MIDIGQGEAIAIHSFSKPSDELVQAAARIGFAAWRAQISESVRSNEELAHMFDPERIQRAMEQAHRSRFAKFAGAIAVAADYESMAAVGVIWGKDEVSGNILRKIQKRLFIPEKNYTAITQLNVLERYQNRGVGTELARTFVSQFDPRHRTTTYIFGENVDTLATARRQGFARDLGPPKVIPDKYYGPHTVPVEQYRHATESNQAFLDQFPPALMAA